MPSNAAPLLLLAGAGLVLFASGKRKKRQTTVVDAEADKKEDEDPDEDPDEDLDEDDDDDIFETDDDEEDEDKEDEDEEDENEEEEGKKKPLEEMLAKYMSPDGKARLGSLYLIQPHDTPLEICREALFGNREPTPDPVRRQAAKELLIRIDCGPWNQAIHAVPLSELGEGHANIDSYFTQKGISFDPIYSDNYTRILNGQKPTAERGGSFAFIWIPMIDVDRFDMEGIVTTEGMYHPDTESGLGHSMIDPPAEILNLEFASVSGQQVGCELPEGDFRQVIVANG